MSSADDPSRLIDWQDGQPVSRRFGDVYFSRESGLDETRHVFLEGNALRERWVALPPQGHFTIGETGFGTALNFAAAWALWEENAPPDARLRYVSIERYPLAPPDIARTLAMWPELARYREALLGQWREVAPGWHRFVFGGGRVLLTLLAGDVHTTLPRLDGRVDAWFLDGFAPARNPEMWQPEVLVQVARLSAPRATCATYSVAGEVRRGLETAGFAVEKTPGFGRKREMLRGVLRTPPRSRWRAPWFARPAWRAEERRAIVIGAGLAGTSTAASLAARGWSVALLDRHETIAAEASGNPQGVLYARLSPHATALTELVTTGLEYTARSLSLLGLERGADFDPCGVLELEYDDSERVRQSRLAAQGWPPGFLARLDRSEASERAGLAVASGGLFFPRIGWVRPPALCRALTTHTAVEVALGRAALSLRHVRGGWEVHAGGGPIAAAPVVVIAASGASATFGETAHLPLRLIRGQLTLVPETPASRSLRTVLCGDGYIAPAVGGVHSLGATHKFRDTSTGVTAAEHAENLAKLAALAPALHAAVGADRLDPARLAGRAALRCSSPDYLPIIGPVVDAARFARSYAPLARDATLELAAPSPWLDGLFVNAAHGSRGLVTAPLSGELLAACLEDEPAPLPESVVQAVHPSRFLLRALIRGRV
ncbi:MAG TPA: bifunctional tRNA (5-methylaminomethyl-2-thiouridine)(34)-methyltransferase MnmD/FAD-dependent 5-carboxymethylaminomethyl-2-thiouridine(34) oxidoreductase MnmC [Burkholderiales bacterium]|nr:bifunctional tRNA (5-methylaminomethyl-2-thiouridine)(34)-methyltransferase MnmD/FAD-dependent 5-carboxymethylaminomethyl-2-thiouridine(34) oxidoreductase MnmC [Burkholderiales bacterium]